MTWERPERECDDQAAEVFTCIDQRHEYSSSNESGERESGRIVQMM